MACIVFSMQKIDMLFLAGVLVFKRLICFFSQARAAQRLFFKRIFSAANTFHVKFDICLFIWKSFVCFFSQARAAQRSFLKRIFSQARAAGDEAAFPGQVCTYIVYRLTQGRVRD